MDRLLLQRFNKDNLIKHIISRLATSSNYILQFLKNQRNLLNKENQLQIFSSMLFKFPELENLPWRQSHRSNYKRNSNCSHLLFHMISDQTILLLVTCLRHQNPPTDRMEMTCYLYLHQLSFFFIIYLFSLLTKKIFIYSPKFLPNFTHVLSSTLLLKI